MSASESASKLASVVAQAAADKGGADLVAFDVSERLPFTDIFLFVTGNSERNVRAIADEIDRRAREHGARRVSVEGSSQWVLVDLGDVIVHVFDQEARTFFALERLWGDCPRLEMQNVA